MIDLTTEQNELLERWPVAKEFRLPANSTIVVVGAYQGLAMELLDDMHHPAKLIGFEPQDWAADAARIRLRNRSNCDVYLYGLGVESRMRMMGEWHTDGCSFVNIGSTARLHREAMMVEADFALHGAQVEHIDLMVMNIEGYEFELLPHLKNIGWLAKIDRLAVQWHTGFGNDSKMTEIMAGLDKDYLRAYDDFPAWVYWSR